MDKKTRNNGYSLLEFLLTIPMTMLVIFGITDVMRVMSAQTAVDSGTESALRCLSPINGACSNTEKDSYYKKFDVYKLNQINRYLVDTYKFQATANNVYTKSYVTNVTANVLDKGYVEAKPYEVTYRELSYPATFNTKYYLMTKSLPQVIGDATKLDGQEFRLKNQKGESYPPKVAKDSKENPFSLTMQKNETSGGRHDVFFTIESPFKDCNYEFPCFVSENVDKKNVGNNTDFSKTCDDVFEWDANTFGDPTKVGNNPYTYTTPKSLVCGMTPILLFIKGSAGISGNDKAKVTIQLIDVESGKVVRDLGGRTFDKDSSASFVARGAKKDNYSGSLHDKFKNQEILYHQAIQVKYDKKYKIHFELSRIKDSSQDDDVTWNFGGLYIFTPEYKQLTYSEKCTKNINKSDEKEKQLKDCSLAKFPINKLEERKNKLKKDKKDESDDKILGDSAYDFDIESTGGTKGDKTIKSNCGLEKSDISEVLVINKIDTNLKSSFVEDKTSSCGQNQVFAFDCPKNYGTKNKNEYKTICKIDTSKIKYDFRDEFEPRQTDKFDIKKVNLGNINWTKENCQDSVDNYIDDNMKLYKDLTTKNIKEENKALNLSNLKFCDESINKKYNCAGFSVKSKNVIPQTSNQERTLLFGKHEGKKCKWEKKKDGWKDILYSEIQANWKDYKDSCFKLTMDKAGKKTRETIPNDQCTEYSLSSLQSSEDKEILAQGVREDSFPSECKNSTSVCEYVFVGYDKNTNYDPSKEKDIEKAKLVAFNKVQALFPGANTGCNSSYCLKFKGNESDKDIQFGTSMSVPIYTLLGKRIDVTSVSSKAKETF